MKSWSINDPDVYVAKLRGGGSKVRYRRKSTGAYLTGWIKPLGPLPRPVPKTALGRVSRSFVKVGKSMAFMGEQASESLKPLAEAVQRMQRDYNELTRDQLRAECKDRELSGYGSLRKGELVAMLNEDDRRANV